MATSITGLRHLVVNQLRSALLQRTVTPLASLPQHRFKQNSRPAKSPHIAKVQEKWTKGNKKKGGALAAKTVKPPSAEWLNRKPVDDVWMSKFYPPQSLSFEECVTRHREYAHPSMLDNMEGLVYADMELDMSTKKKTKFMKSITSTVLPAHLFEDGVEKRCMVFCKSDADQEKAKELGALFVGGPDLVRQILDDEIHKDEYDFVMCTPDMLMEMIPIRTTLKDKFPNKARGNMSADIGEMMHLYTRGITYTSVKTELDAVGKIQIPLGTLEMSTDQLQENLMIFVQSVSSKKSPALGQFIKKIEIIAPPSPESFLLQIQDYVSQDSKDKTEDAESDSDEEEEVKAKAKR